MINVSNNNNPQLVLSLLNQNYPLRIYHQLIHFCRFIIEFTLIMYYINLLNKIASSEKQQKLNLIKYTFDN